MRLQIDEHIIELEDLYRAVHHSDLTDDDIQAVTSFDPWFLARIREIIDAEADVRKNGLPVTENGLRDLPGTLFQNGEKLPTFRHKVSDLMPGTVPRFGPSQIGAWGKRTYGHSRNFEGRIGEVMIFKTPLENEEMAGLFEVSRP